MNISVIELRNYLLKPGMSEHFIDYFEAQFIDTQEAVGMAVLGQFRLVGQPNRFVWIRGFSDMQVRLEGLRGFYGGAVWEQYGPIANDMMLEWSDVHLLRPLGSMTALTQGWSAEAVAAELAAGTISPDTGLIAVDIYQAKPGRRDALIDYLQVQVVPAYESTGIKLRGIFVAEMANEFTRLPVIQNEDELAVFTAYESEEICREKRAHLSRHVDVTLNTLLNADPETLLLSPTLHSPMRYRPE